MNNKQFETVGDILQTNQKELLSSQLQLGKKGLWSLVESIEKLGYTLN